MTKINAVSKIILPHPLYRQPKVGGSLKNLDSPISPFVDGSYDANPIN